jgi:hypothetical protein
MRAQHFVALTGESRPDLNGAAHRFKRAAPRRPSAHTAEQASSHGLHSLTVGERVLLLIAAFGDYSASCILACGVKRRQWDAMACKMRLCLSRGRVYNLRR